MFGLQWLPGQLSDPPEIPIWDKLIHVAIYGLLTLLCLRATHGGISRLRLGPTIAAVALILAYAGFDEWNQNRVSWRVPSARDFLADVVGVGAALLLVAGRVRFGSVRNAESEDGRLTTMESKER
jgi:VanZ family protein